ncbi:MAG: S41 family peptidase [Chthoniobacter sp.]
MAGVAQGDKDFVDSVDMKLDKVVEMIRGKKDTIVRLQVIPSSATDPSVRKIIEIKRDEIKLKEQEAKAEIIERTGPDGNPIRLGWIILPSFYADMEHSGAAGAKSTTKDVLALINRLKQEHIQGLVMDLRKNGGGSLEEAVNLTGLFIKRGPVVQAKDSNGNIHVSKDRDPSIAWDGPLIVCCKPPQRLGQRNLRRRPAGLQSRRHRRRQQHLRQRHRANDAGDRPHHAVPRQRQ